jgi:hypothetical protein
MTRRYSLVVVVLNEHDRLMMEYEIQMIVEVINDRYDMYLVHWILNEPEIEIEIKRK